EVPHGPAGLLLAQAEHLAPQHVAPVGDNVAGRLTQFPLRQSGEQPAVLPALYCGRQLAGRRRATSCGGDAGRPHGPVHGRRRGTQAGTARRYASYWAPNCPCSVGSSYQCTNAAVAPATAAAYTSSHGWPSASACPTIVATTARYMGFRT